MDTKGRWNSVWLRGKSGNLVEIITAYAPPKTFSRKYGPCTVKCQWAQVCADEGEKISDTRVLQWFLDDLLDYINHAIPQGREIILTGDMNIPVFSDEASVFLGRCGMVNLLESFVRTPPLPETAGGYRLTWVTGSRGIVQACRGCHILQANSIIPSDHKAYLCEFDLEELLGGSNHFIETAQGRGLKSSSKHVPQYLQHIGRWIGRNAILERMTAIENMGDKFSAWHHLTKLDVEFSKVRLKAESKIREIRAPWSAKLHQVYLCKCFWYWARKRGCLSKAWGNLAESINWVQMPTCDDHMELRKKHKQAIRILQKCRWQSEKLRVEFLQDKLNKAATQEEATIFQGLINKFEEKEAYRKLKASQGKLHSKGLSEIYIEQPDGTIEKITEVKQMEQYLLNYRKTNHFGQNKGTPLTKEPYRGWLSHNTNTPWADTLVTDRVFLPSSPPIDKFWEEIAKLNMTPWSSLITADDLYRMIKNVIESVASSPSGLHYGHYKCLVAPIHGSEEDKQTYKAFQEQALVLIARILSLCTKWGFSLARWHQVISAMIPKEEGNHIASKLRTIHLFEGDYQLLTAELINNRALAHMERNNNLHPRLYGSRQGRSTQDCAYSRVLCHQLSRLTRQPLEVGDNDAKSSFDRLIIMFAILIMQAMGMDKHSGQVISSTLTQSSYTIKTMYRVSSDSYSWEDNWRVHGPGQGSTIGPTLCLIIFSILFSIMEKQEHKVRFSSPSQHMYPPQNQDGFVEDVSLMATTDKASVENAI
jgi:Reverse transcriptase (RNA-dependent DNA polymerase)